MKRLFEENDRYSQRGTDLGRQIDRLMTPIIKELYLDGYSVRDIELVVTRAVQDVCTHFILTKQMRGGK